jgi:putative transcriptional regulator
MARKFKITNNIRKLRFFANEMTQQELAEKAEVSRQTVLAVDAFSVKIGEVFDCEVEGN